MWQEVWKGVVEGCLCLGRERDVEWASAGERVEGGRLSTGRERVGVSGRD